MRLSCPASMAGLSYGFTMLRKDSSLATTAVTPSSPQSSQITRLVDQVSTIIVGKHEQVTLSVICLLSSGHLLIEDVPGVGKTTLSHALAHSLGLSAARVQFTADLLPSDLIGVSVYDRHKEDFIFHPGPVFAQVLLADEINRAGPRTQSALLEAMEERQVSAGGEAPPLASPVFRDRHPESGGPVGHTSSAGVAVGPLRHAPVAGLPRSGRRARAAGGR